MINAAIRYQREGHCRSKEDKRMRKGKRKKRRIIRKRKRRRVMVTEEKAEQPDFALLTFLKR